jgi:hypothetical protein
MAKFLVGMSMYVKIILGFIGLCIHIWSITICYSIFGFLGAAIAFFLPVITQIYLIIVAINGSGTFFNLFTVVIVGYAISVVVSNIIFVSAAASVENNSSNF